MASKLAVSSDMDNPFQVGFLQNPQQIAYTGTAGVIVQPISDNVNVIRVVCTSAAYIRIGKKVPGQTLTAVTTDHYVPADTPEYFGCNGGDVVSAVQVSAGGNLQVSELKGA